MPRFLVLAFYNLLLPVFFIVAFPGWLLKMWKRGGYGTGLLERFARFKVAAADEPQDVTYVHAVSVGEVLIALKLIKHWLQQEPGTKIVLAATTSTGHAVARKQSPEGVRVIYSPLDFGCMVRAVLRRFRPRQIVLIEAEAWPNLLNSARRMAIPVAMVNARLSARSEARFRKFAVLAKPLFAMVDLLCVQHEQDAARFASLGVAAEKIHVTGSIKFDPSGGEVPRKREAFQAMLDDFQAGRSEADDDLGESRRVVLLASTHAGEEKRLAAAVAQCRHDVLLVVVPRHAERRDEVKTDLEACGYEVVQRSDYRPPQNAAQACLLVDSTGELRDWTAHADVVVIGKSWEGKGGQNPAEAIAARVPVITGPHMGNFEPLATTLQRAGGMRTLSSAAELAQVIDDLLDDAGMAAAMCEKAAKVLASHGQAMHKTLGLLRLHASVGSKNAQDCTHDHE